MAYSEDYIDDDFLEEILCEDCSRSFPMYLLIEHECIYRPINNNEEPTVEEIEAALVHASITDIKKEKEEKDSEIKQNINIADKAAKQRSENIQKGATSSNKHEEKGHKKMKHEDNDYEVIEDNFLQGDETTFKYGLSPNTDKKVEEEKPSYKIPQIPILDENEKKYIIQNDLPDSDNEERESLEDYWKRAEIKLQQRLRTLNKKSMIVDM